jgi:hypothetical protein
VAVFLDGVLGVVPSPEGFYMLRESARVRVVVVVVIKIIRTWTVSFSIYATPNTTSSTTMVGACEGQRRG